MDQELTELRRVSRRLQRTRERHHQLIREASENGATRREVAEAAGLSGPGAVQQILRRLGAIALVALAVLPALASPAEATVIESANPNFQRWADRARVPTPQGAPLTVYHAHPSEAPTYGCTGATLGCADRDGEWMFVSVFAIRNTFLHELGHIFDARHGTEAMRVRFMQIVRRDTWIGSGEESFARLYAVCALHGLHPGPNVTLTVSARMHRQGCRLIRSV